MPHVEVREEHAPVLEDVEEGDLTVGSLDGGVVGDLRHGQAAACGDDRVSLASVRLLSSKEVVAGVLPGTAVDHLGVVSGCSVWVGRCSRAMSFSLLELIS